MGRSVTLRLEADDLPSEVASLQRWLRDDPDTRRLPISDPPPPADGRMGGATDVLQLFLEPSGVATALITALVTWRSTRNRRVRLLVERGGRRVEIEAGSPAEAQRLVREVLDRLDQPGGDDA